MILFTGLRDFTIRNLLESSFAEYATKQNLRLRGLIYEASYEAYAPLLASRLNMPTEPQLLNSYREIEKHGTRLDQLEQRSRFARFGLGKSKAHVTFRRKALERQKASISEKTRFELKLIRGSADHLMGNHKNFNRAFLKSLDSLQQKFAPGYTEHLRQLNPKLVVSCSPDAMYDLVWITAAKKLGIPTAAWLRSWDNVSTKINILPDFDHYILWSDWLKQDLDKYYPEYAHANKVVTGSLQFDNHRKRENLIPREAFFEMMGLDPGKPFILYSVGGIHICPHEIHIIRFIQETLSRMDVAERPQLLVRMHPYIWKTEQDFISKLPSDTATWPRRADLHLFSGSDNDQLMREYKMLVSSLYYQSLQINIASTMTLDSLVFDKPVINIAFDAVPVSYWAKVKHYYQYDHYKVVSESGAVEIIYDQHKLESAIKHALKYPQEKSAFRKKLLNLEAGPMDGLAGERMASFLTAFNS